MVLPGGRVPLVLRGVFLQIPDHKISGERGWTAPLRRSSTSCRQTR